MTACFLGCPDMLRREIRHHRIEYREARLRHPPPATECRLDGAFGAQRGDTALIERAAGEPCITRGIDAFRKAQTHQQELVGDLAMRERLVGDEAVAERLDPHEPGLRPPLGRGGAALARDNEPAMGAWA